jgi:hypothetical protein
VAEDIDANHVALLASTGSDVIGVFHTLSAGKAGQFVPGNVGPPTRADASVGGLTDLVVALETTGATSIGTTTITARTTAFRRDRPRCRLRVIQPVYFAFAMRHARLSNSCSTTRDLDTFFEKARSSAFVE